VSAKSSVASDSQASRERAQERPGEGSSGSVWAELFNVRLMRDWSTTLASAAFHFLLIVVLASWTIDAGQPGPNRELVLLPAVDVPSVELAEPVIQPTENFQQKQDAQLADQVESPLAGEISKLVDPAQNQNQSQQTAASAVQLPDLQQDLPWQQAVPAKSGGGFQGRSGQLQRELLAARGGSAATEDAVTRALAWIAAHQLEDGSWNFNHHVLELGKRSPNPGKPMTSTGATGLALLPFLGKGYTHKNDNPYRDQIDKGLYYLMGHQIIGPNGGDLQDGTMYGHGLAALALCEAYAMTRDPALLQPATEAVQFIEYAQHEQGGWRYQPKQPGDISVLGWQIMALKSALLGDIQVSSSTTGLAEYFLDRVQQADGAYYGYQRPGKMISCTSIGLLSRMYLGWGRDDPRLHQGVAFLSREGPSKTDIYYNYYATNVLCHYGGPQWDRWNDEQKAYLIKTQSSKGYTAGSWYFPHPHAEVGGRLYVTCMSAMILEVYYRHMPLYSDDALEFTF